MRKVLRAKPPHPEEGAQRPSRRMRRRPKARYARLATRDGRRREECGGGGAVKLILAAVETDAKGRSRRARMAPPIWRSKSYGPGEP